MTGNKAPRLLVLGSAGDALLDCAFDEVLVTRARNAARVWAAPERAAVIGTASMARAELHLDACRADGVRVVRRMSGGSAVLLTPGVACASIVLPHAVFPGSNRISGAYRIATSLIARALESLGLATEFRPPGDLAAGGRKIVGLAQSRRREATLVHAAIPAELDLEDVERYLAHPPKEPEYRRGRSHRDFVTTLAREFTLGRGVPAGPGVGGGRTEDVVTALAATFASSSAALSSRGEDAPAACRATDMADELAEAARLVEEKYGDDKWTFRR